MRNIKCIIAYDGRSYQGWQKQGSTEKTIQGRLEQMFSEMLGEDIEIAGAGRTDAGVHARGQVFHFHTNSKMSLEKMQKKANRLLTRNLAILSMEEVDERFHSRLNAKGKWYRYTIHNDGLRDVFNRRYEHQVEEPLDLERMKSAALLLCGTHDFIGFSSVRQREKKSTVRTVRKIDITRDGTKIYLDFYGDGFLYHMVRLLAGSLIEVGLGLKEQGELLQVLETGNRELAGAMAPAQGLCLMSVEY